MRDSPFWFLTGLLLVVLWTWSWLEWWFRTTLPLHVTSMLMRLRIVPNTPEWRPMGEDFYRSWQKLDEWQMWLVVATRGKGWVLNKVAQALSCPRCLSLHIGTAGALLIGLLLRQPWQFFCLAPFTVSASLRLFSGARAEKPAAEPAKAAAPRKQAGFASAPGRVDLRERDFFDLEKPCTFPGCDELRKAYQDDLADLGANCSTCDTTQLRNTYAQRLRAQLARSTYPAPEKLARKIRMSLTLFNPREPCPWPGEDCLTMRAEYLARKELAGDIQALNQEFMQKALSHIPTT